MTQTTHQSSAPVQAKQPQALLQRCACGGVVGQAGECAACRQKREAKEGTLQRQPGHSQSSQLQAHHPAALPDVPPAVNEVLRSPGQPLDIHTRADMEPRFGHDFSRVRVHSDSRAAQSAREVGALAYTVGRHVAFGAGQYRPESGLGRRLIAHELTHVVQQDFRDPASGSVLGIGAATSSFEQEAQQASLNTEGFVPRLRQPVQLARSVPIPDELDPEQRRLAEDYLREQALRRQGRPQGEPNPPGAPVPAGVCGPDVTKETGQALNLTRSTFRGWTDDQKDDHCATLTSTFTGGTAWDIDELHNHEWLQRYSPECAAGGPGGSCFPSVWVNDGCYYPGSVNYALFGTMCRECFDHYAGRSGSVEEYTEKSMLTLIQTYKGTTLPFGIRTASPNFRDSQRWARAGYTGWPGGGSAPPPDRSQCTRCALTYDQGKAPGRLKVSPRGTYAKLGTGEFSVHWASSRLSTFNKNVNPWSSGKSEGWFGGPTWTPNPKDYGF